jgi:hypothetical protein
MIRSVLILVVPIKGWQTISDQSWNVLLVFFASVAPILLAGCALEGWAMNTFGAQKGGLGRIIFLDPSKVMTLELIQCALGVALLFLGSKMILWICSSFHEETTYKQAFNLTAYGLTPVFWMRFLDAFPMVPSWFCWGMGAVGITYVLYHGVALILQPNTSIGFGLYLVTCFTLIALSGMAHFLAQGFAYGNFNI